MRKILHMDLDCFYAAVEIKHRPELRGKPVAVGGPAQSRGVICTANYEARKFGVKAALPSSRAVRMCSQLILLSPRFELYRQESRAVHAIFERFTAKIQPLSLDEAYLDVSESAQAPGEATRIAREIKAAVAAETGLTISAGVAPNKFLAKIASDWKKPDGLFVIPPEKVADFVFKLPVDRLYGVGKVTAQKMHDLGLHTCGDIQSWSLLDLKRKFGSRAMDLYHLSRGEDDREVHTDQERKSLSVEETFARDLEGWDEIHARIPELYEDWRRRIERSGCAELIAGAVVKMKFSDFTQTTHEEATRSFPTRELFKKLTRQAWERRSEPIRLLGFGTRFVTASSGVRDQLSFGLSSENFRMEAEPASYSVNKS